MSGASTTTNGSFSVGYDATFTAIAPNGTRLDISGLTDVDWKPEYKTARSEPLNAPVIERDLPYGHRLTLTVDRKNPQLEKLFSQIEQNWWAQGSVDSGTSNNGTVYLYENNTDGSTTTHQFWGCTMKLSQGGKFKVDSPIVEMIEIFASRWQVAS